ncbi:hypothetical protein ACHAWF_012519 [Thalassiosira exigua]
MMAELQRNQHRGKQYDPSRSCSSAATISTSRSNQLLEQARNLAAVPVWESLRTESNDAVSSEFLLGFLERAGFCVDGDARLSHLAQKLSEKGGELSLEDFIDVVAGCGGLIKEVASNGNGLRVPNFQGLREAIEEVYEKVLPNRSGQNAGYIPQLRDADPEKFGISVCTVDGQQFSIGDADDQFCIQSCSKPLSYLLALSEFGTEYVHGSVGLEPSGRAFNEIWLKDISVPGSGQKHSIPHNPMINAGAMMTVSMVHPRLSRQERLEKVLDYWRDLSGGIDDCIGYSEETYKSESSCADQNWCLAYMMKEFNAFPECFNENEDYKKALEDTLELYFSICSIMNTCRGMATMAATLANGGLNPFTGKQTATAQHVRNVLPLMLSSGMYDFSGQWAFDVGVPAKSGVGGCVFLVVPNLCGISIFSPRLDENGNSVRGVQVASELVKLVKLHNFEVFSGLAHSKIDLTVPKFAEETREIAAALFAASEGDVSSLHSYRYSGCKIFGKDYDDRTALHLAAAEGQLHAVAYLIKHCPPGYLNAKGRWGMTALSVARRYGHDKCVEALIKAGGEDSHVIHPQSQDNDESLADAYHVVVSDGAPVLLAAAKAGNLDEVIKIHSSGVNLGVGDYDTRTALHLAACEGHLHILKYIIINFKGDAALFVKARDRFGNTALCDAKNYQHTECAEYLTNVIQNNMKGFASQEMMWTVGE